MQGGDSGFHHEKATVHQELYAIRHVCKGYVTN